MPTDCVQHEEPSLMTSLFWLDDPPENQWENRHTKDSKSEFEWYTDTHVIARTESAFRAKFMVAKEAWKKETRFLSSSTEIVLNPHYQDIIGMGKKALPFIFMDLEQRGGKWFWALRHITRENPVALADRGKTKKMTEVWLQWGRKNRYL